MASSATNFSNSSSSSSSPGLPLPPSSSSSSIAPKILLAKPGSTSTESPANLRSRLPSVGSLNLLSDSWDFHIDRILPFLTENTDFTVIGVIGTPGSGKSTIMNELYGYFDATSSGMLPPFATQSEETKAMGKHCTSGIELRISTERLILLDTQPLFSPSVLAEMMRPDGSSTISLINGESLSADLAHELIGIQLGIFLASICHVLLVVTEGVYDTDMWNLMLTVDLLKHGIPNPSSTTLSHSQGSNLVTEMELNNILQRSGDDHLASPIFIHSKLEDQDLAPHKVLRLRKILAQYFSFSSFMRLNHGSKPKERICPVEAPDIKIDDLDLRELSLVLLPYRNQDDTEGAQYESFNTMLGKLRDQVLSMTCQSFARTVSEREWLRNSARIWDIVKKSPIFAEYGRTLQNSGMFRS
ncbi:Smg9 [Thalictrum thalictroides]|uniref:Smg9 n=1 Tax=Thalictrum thalictroides TaxID=46969 RepID=A0A7J6X3C8_THATH|nr:Smg9 [Thalictrum thalictroides]